MLLAQAGWMGGYSIVQIAIGIIMLLLVVGIIWALIKYYQIPVPAIVWQIIGFGLLAILAIVVILIVASFARQG